VVTPDPWGNARKFTPARIALGRAGGSLPTAAWLAFAGDHAAARDAVHAALDVEALARACSPLGMPILQLATRATDRATYLRRPDLGRRLDPASTAIVAAAAAAPVDVAVVIADGLSAVAAERHAVPLLQSLIPMLTARRFTIGPISIVTQARVAVEDEIGDLLKARVAAILIGERPGLGAADSLGAYLVHHPSIGRNDAERNCVSNIRPGGFPPAAAAEQIAWLIEQAIVRRISGVSLKDERAHIAGIQTGNLGADPFSGRAQGGVDCEVGINSAQRTAAKRGIT
jgi:ethanolamine ammonia-lyase small subunit